MDFILKFMRPNFSIFSIKKLKKDYSVGFWLDETRLTEGPAIIEYKYNSKRLKFFSDQKTLAWPPMFHQRSRPISKVEYMGQDITDSVKAFAGPRQCEIHPISFFPVTRKFRIKWRFTGVTIGWFDFIELKQIDQNKLIIHRS